MDAFNRYVYALDSPVVVTFALPTGAYCFRADKNETRFWSGTTNHCSVPACAAVTITTTVLITVAIRDTDGVPEPGLTVYAFDGDIYTGYQGTTEMFSEEAPDLKGVEAIRVLACQDTERL